LIDPLDIESVLSTIETFPETMEVVVDLLTQSIPDLRIERIETIPVRVPLKRVFEGGHYKITHRSTIITRVYTVGGIIGEAYAGDEDADLAEIDGIIHDECAPKLIGEEAFAIKSCWELTPPATWDILLDRRLGLVATADIDMALWNAIGRALNIPLWKPWGGYKNSVPVISNDGHYAEDADIDSEVTDLVNAQFTGMKFKVRGLSPEEDAKRASSPTRSGRKLCARCRLAGTFVEQLVEVDDEISTGTPIAAMEAI